MAKILNHFLGEKNTGDFYIEKEICLIETLDTYFVSMCERATGCGTSKTKWYTSCEIIDIHAARAKYIQETLSAKNKEGFLSKHME